MMGACSPWGAVVTGTASGVPPAAPDVGGPTRTASSCRPVSDFVHDAIGLRFLGGQDEVAVGVGG